LIHTTIATPIPTTIVIMLRMSRLTIAFKTFGAITGGRRY